MRIDVLNLRIQPDIFEAEKRNLILVRQCKESLMRWLNDHGPHMITGAFIEVDFSALPAARFWGELIDVSGHTCRKEITPQGLQWKG